MTRNHLSLTELLMLQEMCLDRELQCWQRAAEAAKKGDYQVTDFELELKEHYSDLKQKMLEELSDRGHFRFPEPDTTDASPVREQLQSAA